MYPVEYSNQFKKDLKKITRQGKKISKLQHIVALLVREDTLPAKHRTHALTGNWKGYWECHIEPDWLLIYQYTEDLILRLARTGSHSELFS